MYNFQIFLMESSCSYHFGKNQKWFLQDFLYFLVFVSFIIRRDELVAILRKMMKPYLQNAQLTFPAPYSVYESLYHTVTSILLNIKD